MNLLIGATKLSEFYYKHTKSPPHLLDYSPTLGSLFFGLDSTRDAFYRKDCVYYNALAMNCVKAEQLFRGRCTFTVKLAITIHWTFNKALDAVAPPSNLRISFLLKCILENDCVANGGREQLIYLKPSTTAAFIRIIYECNP